MGRVNSCKVLPVKTFKKKRPVRSGRTMTGMISQSGFSQRKSPNLFTMVAPDASQKSFKIQTFIDAEINN